MAFTYSSLWLGLLFVHDDLVIEPPNIIISKLKTNYDNHIYRIRIGHVCVRNYNFPFKNDFNCVKIQPTHFCCLAFTAPHHTKSLINKIK